MSEYHVVVTRFNEDVSWAREIEQNRLFIYDKSPEPLPGTIRGPNIGNENETMLRHIIEHYDDLPEYTIFLQGNPWDHMKTKTNMMDVISRHLADKPQYFKPFDTDWHDEHPLCYRNIYVLEICDGIFVEPIVALKFAAGCQYIVSRDAIRCRPIEFYKKLHEMLIMQGGQKWLGRHSVPPCNPRLMNGWVMERITPLMFNPDVKIKHAYLN